MLVGRFFSSGAAVNPDGPAPKGMLANYTVFLTTVPPPPPSPSSPLPSVSSPGDAAVPTPGAAVVVAVAAAYGEEADVRDALVDRDVGESIVCRRRYRILPDFGPGDRPYVVRGEGKRGLVCWIDKLHGTTGCVVESWLIFVLCLAVVSVQSRHRVFCFESAFFAACARGCSIWRSRLSRFPVRSSVSMRCSLCVCREPRPVTFSPSAPVLHFAKPLFRTPRAHPFPAPKRPTTASRHDFQDRDYTIPSLPVELQGVRLTCVQTAQGDKRAGGSRFWRLSLMQVGAYYSARWSGQGCAHPEI